jgi:hypothetical protein
VLLSVAPACRLPILGVKQISCLIKVDRPFKVHGELGDQRKGKWDATISIFFGCEGTNSRKNYTIADPMAPK